MNPVYPVYIISKGRWASRLTVKSLEDTSVPYHIVVEPQEVPAYSAVIDPAKILVLPFSNLKQGSIPARNWVWEHAIQAGAARHWILDDNIRYFWRVYKNRKIRFGDGSPFRIAEIFVDRYENVALAGFQYATFIPSKGSFPPCLFNTRIYSSILIDNKLPYRWRGIYNEDTDLSLRVLKDGWCTVLFNIFVAHKTGTMRMKGGNTDELYKGDGRLRMAQSLQRQHPDIAKIFRKWGRWQHRVDYRAFKKNRLKFRLDISPLQQVNNYGIQLVNIHEPLYAALTLQRCAAAGLAVERLPDRASGNTDAQAAPAA